MLAEAMERRYGNSPMTAASLRGAVPARHADHPCRAGGVSGNINSRQPAFRACAMGNEPVDELEGLLRPLWLRGQAGDESAYRDALSVIAGRLRSFLRRRMQGTPDDVEDLVQETLFALHLQRGTYDPALPVSAWALAIARHKLADHWRRRGRREDLHQPLDDTAETLLATPAPAEGGTGDIDRLLGALPEAQRAAILFTKVEGLSVSEAAVRARVSESALKVQVHRGLKRLAALLRS
jgi:RNA polymerase sigma-70 factor (ECF subfamily)